MIIFRARDYHIMEYIIPHLVEDGSYNRNIIAEEILNMMVNSPDDVCIAVVFEGSDLVSYTIGWVIKNREYIWLGQSWIKAGVSRNNIIDGLRIVKLWAIEEHNIHEIRFETERNPKALSRAWGFDIHGYIMNCEF